MTNKHTILFQAKVLSVDDPLMLGRIRAVRLIDNEQDILKSITDPKWDPKTDPWTQRDPFIFVPLLPYFVYQTPKKDELIQVIYVNHEYKFQNQYYVQSNFSSPTATFAEFYKGGDKLTGLGIQYTNSKPLKNSDGTFTEKGVHAGVFPEPGDNGFLGRGSADFIVKQDEILLRAGKFKEVTLQPNIVPFANQKRGFLQLSKFPNFKKTLPDRTIFEGVENVLLVKYLIEWVITNPENTKDLFVGQIYLFQLKPDASTNSQKLTVDSKIDENLKSLIYETDISGSKKEIITQINNFIKTCNSSNFYKGFKLFPDNDNDTKFPIFYRPSSFTYSVLNPSTPIGKQSQAQTINNVRTIYNQIKLNPALQGGYGLIYTLNKVGTPTEYKKKIIPQSEYVNQPTTYGALGADTIFLLSHNSTLPGKTPINFDNTLYGISGVTFADEIIPKTSSMVRGEQLMELINLIVRFLITHTHAYPGLPPVPITQEGVSSEKILEELQNAVNKILNGNIRLN